MSKNRLKAIIVTVITVSVVFGGSAYAFYKHVNTNDVATSPEVASTNIPNENNDVTIAGDISDTKKDAPKDKKEEVKKKEESKDTKTDSPKDKEKSITSKGKRINDEVKGTSKSSNDSKVVRKSEAQSNDWVNKLNVAKQCSQLITVQASGKTVKVEFHEKGKNGWHEVFSTNGYVGYNGITSHKREGDGKTPVGVYSIDTAFGIAGNPGTSLNYRHINGNDYWVDDTRSSHYNEWVNTSNTKKDWNSAERMSSQPVAYRYGMVINYNTSRTRGNGSAIFLHCSKGGGTAGCVAISQSKIVELIKDLHPGARIVISSYNGIYNY